MFFILDVFFSRTLSFGQKDKRDRTCGRKNIFRHREFKKRRGEIKKRFDVLIKTPKRFTSNVETFLRCLSGRISRFLTIGYKSDFTSSGSSDLLIFSVLK
jgi:hypothetical protein